VSLIWGFAAEANVNLVVAHALGEGVAAEYGMSGSVGLGFGAGSLITVTGMFPSSAQIDCGD
jgi:hypothetical protein